ncbi:MAG: hypothetical protein V2J07_06720 [Anaerolineae bacterium]|jgi:hypothetical protein|nr:hypothetical protein [Anaerolineae bacterium]
MPKTTLGKWSLILIVVMPVLLFVGTSLSGSLYEGVPAGDTLPQDILARPLLAVSMLAGFGCGIAALVTGLIAILKEKERAGLVFVSTIIGGLTTILIIGQMLFPE